MKTQWRKKLAKGGWPLALACAALAAGGIVLLKAPGHAAPRPPDIGRPFPTTPNPTPANAATSARFSGPSLNGHLALGQGAVLANGTRRMLAEVRVTAAEDAVRATERQPVALSIVMDVSGSMCGEKIEQARGAVRQLVERMRDGDQVAVVTYDHETTMLQPLSRVGSVRQELYGRIAAIQCRGGTVIPQALERGAQALEGAPSTLVRRLVLLSDGLDGSGQSVEMVSGAIRSRATAGIATSALGIGSDYDERFMTAVADAGRGNYEFLASGDQLQRFLHRELDEAGATVVDGVEAIVSLPPGTRIRGVHGAEMQGDGAQRRIAFGPLFAGDSRRAVLDLEVDAGSPGAIGALAARVAYRTVSDTRRHELEPVGVGIRAAISEAEVAASRDEAIYGETWAVVIDAEQKQAVEAWRAGDVARAQALSRANATQLRDIAVAAPAAARVLEAQAAEYEQDEASFGSVSAGSADGRAYGLRSNAQRRARAMH